MSALSEFRYREHLVAISTIEEVEDMYRNSHWINYGGGDAHAEDLNGLKV